MGLSSLVEALNCGDFLRRISAASPFQHSLAMTCSVPKEKYRQTAHSEMPFARREEAVLTPGSTIFNTVKI